MLHIGFFLSCTHSVSASSFTFIVSLECHKLLFSEQILSFSMCVLFSLFINSIALRLVFLNRLNNSAKNIADVLLAVVITNLIVFVKCAVYIQLDVIRVEQYVRIRVRF